MLSEIEDRAELRRTAELYAQGADRRDRSIWEAVLAEDIRIDGPGFELVGIEAVLGSLDLLSRYYARTQHRVHNQLVEINGDGASGETYSTADHLISNAGGGELLCWAIRYQDEWRREGAGWRFTRRSLIVDWEERRPILSNAPRP